MIILRRRYFAGTDTAGANESALGGGSMKINTGGGFDIKKPESLLNRTSETNTPINMGEAVAQNRVVGMATKKLNMMGSKAFSDNILGNTYKNAQVVSDKYLLNPIENVSKNLEGDEVLEKPTRKWRNRVKGYISGIRLLRKKVDDLDRLPVSKSDLKKAKSDGVVQKRPDGKWGIISVGKKLWWSTSYSSREKAEAALRAYHASKG